MKTRTNENLKVIIILAVLGILAVLAIKTIWVGFNLAMCSSDVIESSWHASEYAAIREEANAVYESTSVTRAKFYNSSDLYIRWLSNMSNNLVRLPFSLFMICSPWLFICVVRKYNMYKRRQRRARR